MFNDFKKKYEIINSVLLSKGEMNWAAVFFYICRCKRILPNQKRKIRV